MVLTILKNMKGNGKDYPIYEMENKTCSKPPTSIWYMTSPYFTHNKMDENRSYDLLQIERGRSNPRAAWLAMQILPITGDSKMTNWDYASTLLWKIHQFLQRIESWDLLYRCHYGRLPFLSDHSSCEWIFRYNYKVFGSIVVIVEPAKIKWRGTE